MQATPVLIGRGIAGLCLLTLLSACATPELAKFQEGARETADHAHAQFPTPEQSTNRRRVVVVDDSYFGRRVETVSRNRQLPPLFDREVGAGAAKLVALYQDERINLSELADLIQAEINVPVRIDPSVYIRSTTLNSNTGTGSGGAAGAAANSQPGQVANLANDYERNVTVRWSGKLPPLLDRVASRLGIDWEYQDGVLIFYRFKTVTIGFNAPRGSRSQSRGFAVDGQLSSGAGQGGSGSTRSSVGVTSKVALDNVNYYRSIEADLNALRSAGAPPAVVNETLGTITLTDTPSVLAKMATVVDEARRRLGRRGVIRLDFIKITGRSADEIGLALDTIITADGGKQRWFTSSPSSVLSEEVGSLAGSALTPGGVVPTPTVPGQIGDGIRNMMGSTARINALMGWAKTAERVTYRTRFRNTVPVNLLEGETERYVESGGTTQGNTSSQTTITQADITTGLSLSSVVSIGDNNEADLDFLLDSSGKQFTVAGTISGVQIKSPRVPRTSFDQQINLRIGEVVPIAFLSRNTGNSSTHLALGGSSSRVQEEDTIVVLASITLTD
ncbi:hypothetical protein [Chitinimonas koreensis]|uniref:hypothetical protein n=1 Tax=Chitinimonas koreensis TaxID=356302 RepID=UPI0004135DEF|nr:hypothetical protein [Chitinimonas koreensis]QNM95520.1 hypothetical protein H9L41_16840 [Chitinimonas koreensis]